MSATTARGWKARRAFESSAIIERIRTLVEFMKRFANYTQNDFAKKTGISASRLSHYLAGHYHPRVDTLAQISERLGVNMDWLVFGVGPIWKASEDADDSQVVAMTAATMLADISKRLAEGAANGGPLAKIIEDAVGSSAVDLQKKPA